MEIFRNAVTKIALVSLVKMKRTVVEESQSGALLKLWDNRHLSSSQILSADENKVRASWMAPGMWSV